MNTLVFARNIASNVRAVLVVCMFLIAPVASMAAGTQGGALVTDLTGTAAFEGATQGSLTILSVIQADARVRLASAARLTVLVLESGDEFIFIGPAVIRFSAAEPQVLEGSKPEKHSSPFARTGKGVVIDPSGLSQATFVMRGVRHSVPIRILSPQGIRVIDARPEFRWQAVEPGAKYLFKLTDDNGASIYEFEGEGTLLRLPLSVTLKEGMNYSWNVSTSGRDGTDYLGSGNLSLASSELKARVDKLRPSTGAPVSERVAFAVWLMQMGLKDEARSYWNALARERPQDTQLKSLAEE